MAKRKAPARRVQIRDRIREFRRVRAGDLTPNPNNWRTHPPEQRAALQGILQEVEALTSLYGAMAEEHGVTAPGGTHPDMEAVPPEDEFDMPP